MATAFFLSSDLGSTPADIARARRLLVPTGYRGVHAGAGVLELADKCRAALHTQDDRSMIGYRTAACLLCLPWRPAEWDDIDNPIHIAAPVAHTHGRRGQLRIRIADIPPEQRTAIQGLPVTSPARTVVDLVRERDVPRVVGLQLMDGVRRFCGVTAEDLEVVLASLGSRKGIKRARELVALSRDGVDSARESVLRLALIDGGVPGRDLEVALEIRDQQGRVLARADLTSKRFMIWGEYDGEEFHGEDARVRDAARDEWLDSRGWLVIRVRAADLADPQALARLWLRHMAEAPARLAAMRQWRSPELAAARARVGL